MDSTISFTGSIDGAANVCVKMEQAKAKTANVIFMFRTELFITDNYVHRWLKED